MKRKTGIITGAGPEAGIDLWKLLLEENRLLQAHAYRGDIDAPEVYVHSIPELGLVMEVEQHRDKIWNSLRESLINMDKHVDCFAIACNILHAFSDEISDLNLTAKFVSIVDVVDRYLQNCGETRVGLMSIGKVIELGQWSPYRDLAEKISLETPGEVESLNGLVESIKREGANQKHIVEAFDAIVEQYKSEKILMACTELPLVKNTAHADRLVNVNRLLARALAYELREVS